MKEELHGLPEEVFIMGNLLLKYVQGKISTEERELLDAWIAKSEKNQKLFEELTHKDLLHARLTYYYNIEERKAAAADKIMEQNFPGSTGLKQMGWKWRRMTAAAAILLLLAGGVYFLLTGNKNTQVVKTENPDKRGNDIAPGKDGAILKLGDGRFIVLDTAIDGNLVRQGNMQVRKKGAVLAYNVQGNMSMSPGVTEEVLYNTLTTPRGRQFQLALPDGSRVWLNAASSITFPTTFTGKERKVEITGEAYFEVARPPLTTSGKEGKKVPFIVDILSSTGEAGGGQVEVLGTHFNINAYNDEPVIKTTLLEGSVKVVIHQSSIVNRQSVILQPGQQAVVISSTSNKSHQIQSQPRNIGVQTVDLEQIIAWKNGAFHFKDEDIKTVMRQLARWYDVEVIYGDNQQQGVHFGGVISRNTNLSEVLKMLELSDVRFKIEGEKIIAVP